MQLKMQQTCEGACECTAHYNWAQSGRWVHPHRTAYRTRGIKVAAPPLGLPSERQVTYPGDILYYSRNLKIKKKSKKERSVTLIIAALIIIAILSQLYITKWRPHRFPFGTLSNTNVYLLYLLLTQLNSLYAATIPSVCTQHYMKVI
jgi:hypothetical protein